MQSVDGVASGHHARADEQGVVDGIGGQGAQGGGDHGRGMAAEHAVLVNVAG